MSDHRPAIVAWKVWREHAERAEAERDELLAALREHQQLEGPGWDTKIHCACGERFASRAEWAFHRFKPLDVLLARIEGDTKPATFGEHGWGLDSPETP